MSHVIKLIPLCLFTAFAVKLLVLGNVTLENCLILLILGGVHSLYQFKLRLDSNKELEKKLQEIEASRALEKEELEKIKSVINVLKTAQGLRAHNAR